MLDVQVALCPYCHTVIVPTKDPGYTHPEKGSYYCSGCQMIYPETKLVEIGGKVCCPHCDTDNMANPVKLRLDYGPEDL